MKKEICMQQFITINFKGQTLSLLCFREVISADKKEENFCLICGTKCCFALLHFAPEEAKYKLYKVRKIFVHIKGIPYPVTHNACSICCPDRLIKVNDAVQINVDTGTPNRTAKQSNG